MILVQVLEERLAVRVYIKDAHYGSKGLIAVMVRLLSSGCNIKLGSMLCWAIPVFFCSELSNNLVNHLQSRPH